MFVIVHNNSVILGPMRWNRYRFENVIQEECELSVSLPSSNEKDPLLLSADVRILPVEPLPLPEFNSKIEFLHGPFWEFTDQKAISSFTVQRLPIDAVKNKLISVCADERWRRESVGVKTNIQGADITVDTRRGNRDIFVQKYLLMNESDTVRWKFPEEWATLSKVDLAQIVSAGAGYIQSQFDWESSMVDSINACSTLEELDALVIVEPVNENRRVV